MSTPHTNADYRRKIKTREQLKEILGPRPREHSVIMCHGTFDLVHPGHIRHLLFAKSKADILLASITSDAHINKADYRPFVPQELRAMNLAALEAVDYVVIDENPTAIDNIKFLQPDYYAKGYEYLDGGMPPETQEEMDAINSYAGSMIFTPGDVVYSSSAIIDRAPPNISIEKLIVLMESEGVTFDGLKSVLKKLSAIRVHVVGDTIVDTYTNCTVIGSATTKTPTLSVRYDREIDFAGGAAVVARNLRAAGAEVRFSTVLGDDNLKDFIIQEMKVNGIDCDPIIDPSRITTQKRVFIAGNHHLLKVDNVDNRTISNQILERLKEALASSNVDVYVFSDFRHGIFNRSTIPQLKASLPDGCLKVADSQVASRWGNILDFEGFDLLTPNEREARFALGDQDSVIRPLAMELYTRARCKCLILKLGDHGILTYRAPDSDVRSFFGIDSFATDVVDPMGAGDALLAYSTLALAASESDVIASVLGSVAAAVACGQEGNRPVSLDDVQEKLTAMEQQAHYV